MEFGKFHYTIARDLARELVRDASYKSELVRVYSWRELVCDLL